MFKDCKKCKNRRGNKCLFYSADVEGALAQILEMGCECLDCIPAGFILNSRTKLKEGLLKCISHL